MVRGSQQVEKDCKGTERIGTLALQTLTEEQLQALQWDVDKVTALQNMQQR